MDLLKIFIKKIVSQWSNPLLGEPKIREYDYVLRFPIQVYDGRYLYHCAYNCIYNSIYNLSNMNPTSSGHQRARALLTGCDILFRDLDITAMFLEHGSKPLEWLVTKAKEMHPATANPSPFWTVYAGR